MTETDKHTLQNFIIAISDLNEQHNIDRNVKQPFCDQLYNLDHYKFRGGHYISYQDSPANKLYKTEILLYKLKTAPVNIKDRLNDIVSTENEGGFVDSLVEYLEGKTKLIKEGPIAPTTQLIKQVNFYWE